MRKFPLAFLLLLTACTAAPEVVRPPDPTVSAATPIAVSPSPLASSPTSTPSISQPPTPQPIQIISRSDEPNGTAAFLTAQEATTKINVRVNASTRAKAQHYGLVGDPVTLLEKAQNGEGEEWYRVRFEGSGAEGWVRSDFVSLSAPTTVRPASPAPVSVPSANLGEPLRSPVSGSCECPYDTDKAGRRCGGRSAYARPGGAAPACFVGDP